MGVRGFQKVFMSNCSAQKRLDESELVSAAFSTSDCRGKYQSSFTRIGHDFYRCGTTAGGALERGPRRLGALQQGT
jgi:hypothetical protein